MISRRQTAVPLIWRAMRPGKFALIQKSSPACNANPPGQTHATWRIQMRNTWPQTTLAIFVLRLALVLLLTLGLGTESLAQGGKPPRSSPINVTSTVHDYTDSTNLFQNLLRSDATDQASYATGGNVRSQIFSFWYLDLRSQTARSVYLTFSATVSGPSNPLPDGYYNAEVLSRCYDTNNNIIDFLSVKTSDNRCSLRVEFTHNGTAYSFVMSPEYAGTGWATVACNAVNNSSGACVSWTITPTPSSQVNNATVANLYIDSHGGKQTLVGSYYNTYRIDVTNP
jgi:hypothetical protein